MAATNTNKLIADQKAAARLEINILNDRLRQAAQRVPQFVLDGSHQATIAWKQQAEAIFYGKLKSGSSKASLRSLRNLIAIKTNHLNYMLHGEQTEVGEQE